MFNAENAIKKWQPILEHKDATPIKDAYRKAVTAKLLENTESALREQAELMTEAIGGTAQASAKYSDPVLISLVRRAMPQLIAYDICGVQPMSGPTGLIFAMKARYNTATPSSDIDSNNSEALFDEADNTVSGTGSGDAGTGNTTANGELGITANMGFSIEKNTVTARTRALKAEYSMELSQDLKAIHGLDAESELSNILSQEILSEINREVLYQIRYNAVQGADQNGISTNGTFDLIADADGRWAVERFQSLLFQIDLEANQIFTNTRRGKGNWAVVHSDVASALAATGKLDSTGVGSNINSDYAGNTLIGSIGAMKVYVDPYADAGDVVVGYRGSSPFDAGFFYCPYVPLTMVKTVGEDDFQPKIAFKTRYGVAHNPIINDQSLTAHRDGSTAAAAFDTNPDNGLLSAGANPYFNRFTVTSINLDS
ncbi:MAG: ATP-binding protein [Betaproteobacteria bacterium]